LLYKNFSEDIMETNNNVEHPKHYQLNKAVTVIEVLDVIDAWELNFSLGNVIKYVLRAGKKLNNVEDLEKAVYYLRRHIDNIKDGSENVTSKSIQ